MSDELGSVFDSQQTSMPTQSETMSIGDIFDAAMSAPMIPGIPSPTLGTVATYVNEAFGLPGTIARKTAEAISPEGAKAPLFPTIAGIPTAPIPGISGTTVGGGAEFAANMLAPTAVGLGEGLLEEMGTRGRVLPETPEALPRPYDIETTAVEQDIGKIFDSPTATKAPETIEEIFKEPIETAVKPEPVALPQELPVGTSTEAGNINVSGEDLTSLKQKIFDEPFDISGQYSEIGQAKAEYLGDLQERLFNAQLAIRDITKNLSPLESEAMPFVAEGSTIPQKWLDDPAKAAIVNLIQNPTPAMQESLAKYQIFRENYAKELSIHIPDFSEREDYAPHILEAPTVMETGRVGRATGATPFVKQRVLQNLGEAIDLGYTKRYSDFGKDLTAYSGSVEKALAQKQFANYITKTKTNEVLRVDEHGRAEYAPLAYPKFVKDLETGKYVPNKDLPAVVKNGAEISPLLKDHYLTPAVYNELQFMKGLEQPNNFARAYEMTAAALKKAELSFSIFHHITLSESSLALGVNPLKLAKNLIESKKAGMATLVNPELTKDALKHNLVIGHGVVDVKQGLIDTLAEKADQAINYAKSKLIESPNLDAQYVSKALKPVAKLEEIWDAALWNHLHPMIKLMAYEQNVASLLGSGKFNHIPIDVLKRQVADVVNNFAGGQPWELVFNDPKMQTALNRGLLALDWTASNLRIPLSLPAGGAKGYVARRAWLRLAILFLGTTEMANLINTEIQTGEAKPTWDNDVHHKFDVWLFKDSKGMNHYMTLNKGFIEPFRWLTNPAKELTHKINPVLQMMFEQLSGHTMAGYDLDFAKPGNRLKAVTDKVLPFSMGGGTFLGALPVSQGVSVTSLKQDFEKAIYSNDQAKIQELLKTASNNGINGISIYKQVKQQIKHSEKYEKQKASKPSPTFEVMQTYGSAFERQFQSILNRVREQMRKK